MTKLFLLLFLLVNSSALYAQVHSQAGEYCQLQLVSEDITSKPDINTKQLPKNQVTFLTLPAGKSRIRLTCSLDEQAVFTFGKEELMRVSWETNNINPTQLAASSPAFLLPAGNFSIDYLIQSHDSYNQNFVWKSVATFLDESLLNNITMAIFYGLCLTLIVYVFFMGRVVGDNRFQFYSLYVFCAATFFLLQEGQLNIFLPQQNYLLSHQFYVFFAGLTVFTATIFIVRLTDVHTTWPKLTRYGLEMTAGIVLILAACVIFLGHNELSSILGSLMAELTLLIMLGILTLVAIQAYRGVQSTKLVFFSLLLMVVAMVFRIFLNDVSPFLQRYALIIAFAIEALMLAIAVSARIRNIRASKLLAESQANTDELCNVLNRRGWDKKVNEILVEQKTNGGVICLLYIDLDDFKLINDQHGHDSGDKVLKVVADIIRHQLRSVDCVGRLGGDEFVALGIFEERNKAESMASRMQDRLKAINLHIDTANTLNISASVGHVIYDTPPQGAASMLSQADEAMYQIKRSAKPS